MRRIEPRDMFSLPIIAEPKVSTEPQCCEMKLGGIKEHGGNGKSSSSKELEMMTW